MVTAMRVIPILDDVLDRFIAVGLAFPAIGPRIAERIGEPLLQFVHLFGMGREDTPHACLRRYPVFRYILKNKRLMAVLHSIRS